MEMCLGLAACRKEGEGIWEKEVCGILERGKIPRNPKDVGQSILDNTDSDDVTTDPLDALSYFSCSLVLFIDLLQIPASSSLPYTHKYP